MPLPVIPIEPPYRPELLPEVAARIEGILPDGAHVFEFGSGASTVWFAEMGCRVVTVEHEQEWADEVLRALRDAGLARRVELFLVEDESKIPGAIYRYWYRDCEFDAIFVDCLSTVRRAAIGRAVPHIRPGGYLIVDDSHWSILWPAIRTLQDDGWSSEEMSGMHTRKTGERRKSQTCFLRRPEKA